MKGALKEKEEEVEVKKVKEAKHSTDESKKGISLVLIIILLLIVAAVVFFVCNKPKMEIADNGQVEINSTIEKPKTTYMFKDVTDNVVVNGDVDTSKMGEYEVEYELKTLIGKYTKKVKLSVVDTTAPTIELSGEKEFKQSYKKEFEDPGFKATDACDGDVTEKVTSQKEEINENEYNMVYTVADAAGNKAEIKRHVTIVDDVAPEIKLKGQANMYVTLNSEYKEEGAEVIDEKDGDLTSNLEITGTVDSKQEGLYTITYKAKDKSGNEATAERHVNVSKTGIIGKQDGTNGKKGVVYLTFDDGPSAATTPKILDVLDKKGVKATFFIINYNEDGEKLVKREHESGHTVAIHGYSHTYSEIYQSVDTYVNNITKLRDKIRKSIGTEATITRFPGGSSNTISRHYCQGIMSTLTREMVARGYSYFDWNVDSDDAGSAKSSDDVYRNVTRGLSKERANVVLMHDFSGNDKTLNALEKIIDFGLENGYTFEALTPDTPMVTHQPNN